MIMEYVEGQSLAQRLRHGAIPTPQAIAYMDQVLDALDYAHKQHVVHRDIKPANMMVTPAGVVKLMDFGIARAKGDQTLTAVDTTTGSLGYMSPEQVHGKPTDGRSDLYSVGISLYEMVTGERPFKSNSDFAVMLAQVNEQPRPPIELLPALSPELNAIILKAIEKDPGSAFSVGGRIPSGVAHPAGSSQRGGVEHGQRSPGRRPCQWAPPQWEQRWTGPIMSNGGTDRINRVRCSIRKRRHDRRQSRARAATRHGRPRAEWRSVIRSCS